MSRPALRALVIWLLAMAAGLTVIAHSRFSADMSFFLPARPSAEQQVLIEQLQEGAVSRLLMLGIEGGDSAQRAALSRALYGRLAGLPDFVSVQNGEAGSLDVDRDLLLRWRYLLSPAVNAERFSVDGLRQSISDSIDLLASPAGMLFKPFLTRDPTGELATLLAAFNPASQPDLHDGVWASRDGERAILIVQTRALGADTDGQAAAIKTLREQFAELRQMQGAEQLRLLLSGPGHFAVESRALIEAEVSRLTLISALAIIAILFFIYRSPWLIGLGLLPVLSGAVAGLVAVSLVHGTVFGITVGFGSALIGEAVDYSTYYFLQAHRLGRAGWQQRFWPTIRLGVATSVFGFGALLFSGFPGLAQLGLYSLAGVLTAALVTRHLLPDLAAPWLQSAQLTLIESAGQRLHRVMARLPSLRWPVIALALLAALQVARQADTLWHPDLSALSTVSEADAAIDGRLRADLGAPDSRYLVVVRGPDQESALQAAERAGQRLDQLVAAGAIGSYDTPTRFLPSLATQSSRRDALPAPDDLRQRLPLALADQPLAAGKLQPFLDDIAAARELPALTRAELNGSHVALAVDALLLQSHDRWSVLLPLHPAASGLEIPVDQVRAALVGSDALFIDMKGEFDRLYGDYLDEAITLSLAGCGAIVLLLAANLRCRRKLFAVLLPLALTVLLVVAGQLLADQKLHLLHLIGLLLIVAVGSNYALFFVQTPETAQHSPDTLLSIGVANLTTAIGFGTLALSPVPVLNAIGSTVGPGAILALLLSAIFVPRGTAR